MDEVLGLRYRCSECKHWTVTNNWYGCEACGHHGQDSVRNSPEGTIRSSRICEDGHDEVKWAALVGEADRIVLPGHGCFVCGGPGQQV